MDKLFFYIGNSWIISFTFLVTGKGLLEPISTSGFSVEVKS